VPSANGPRFNQDDAPLPPGPAPRSPPSYKPHAGLGIGRLDPAPQLSASWPSPGHFGPGLDLIEPNRSTPQASRAGPAPTDRHGRTPTPDVTWCAPVTRIRLDAAPARLRSTDGNVVATCASLDARGVGRCSPGWRARSPADDVIVEICKRSPFWAACPMGSPLRAPHLGASAGRDQDPPAPLGGAERKILGPAQLLRRFSLRSLPGASTPTASGGRSVGDHPVRSPSSPSTRNRAAWNVPAPWPGEQRPSASRLVSLWRPRCHGAVPTFQALRPRACIQLMADQLQQGHGPRTPGFAAYLQRGKKTGAPTRHPSAEVFSRVEELAAKTRCPGSWDAAC